MSHPRKIFNLIWNTLGTTLCAGGVSCIFLTALLGSAFVLPTFVICAVAAFMLSCLDLLVKPRLRLIVLGALFALEIGLYFMEKGSLHLMVQSAKAVYLTFSGVPAAVLPYAQGLALGLGLVFTLISYFLVRDDSFGFASFCALTLLGLGLYFTQGEGIHFALPVMGMLLMVLSAQHERKTAALPVAACIALCALLFLPHQGTVHEPLAEAAQDIRDATEDYFFFTDEREAFSMYRAGFQPLKERLGGKASPNQEAVMEVHGPANDTVYLRATAYNEYTGLNWYDTISSRRYLFSSPMHDTLRTAIFDMNLPLSADMETQNVSVRMLQKGTTTLFTPQRLRSVQTLSNRMVPYFNTAGEVYITRNAEPDDRYEIAYLPLDVKDASVRQLIQSSQTADDPRYSEVMNLYAAVPGHIQQEVHDLAAEITKGLTDPLSKALAIRDYLKNNYTYNLDVEEPSSSVDFVALFLLGSKEGYCTYFASAQTILSRMAGIPARYTVGYMARTDENGLAVVTGEDAHAWTEIYLNGFGWLTLDATPGRQQDGDDSDEQDEQDNLPDSPPTPTPSPTPTPTPEPPVQDEPTPTPTPDPAAPENTPTPTPQPPEQKDEEDDPPFPWLWVVLALLLIALLCLWFIWTDPDNRARRSPHKGGDIYLTAVMRLLICMGMKRQSGETLLEFARRVSQIAPLEPLFDMASAMVYGKNKAADAHLAGSAYAALRQKATPWQKVRFRLRMLIP